MTMWLTDQSNCELKGPWSESKVIEHIEASKFPMRISVVSSSGWPIIASLWFVMDSEGIWSATHKSSQIAKILCNDSKCGFEIARETPPYCGIRGQALADINKDKAETILLSVIDKYQGNRNTSLSKWLLSRVEDEVALRLRPAKIQSWDYTARMQK